MKTAEKIRTSILMMVILLLLFVLFTGNKPLSVENKTNEPENYKPFMYYNSKSGKIFAKGYDFFTYGLDSCIHVVDVENGENSLYFVLYDMSIQFTITKYKE